MDDSDNFIFNNGFGEPYGTEGGCSILLSGKLGISVHLPQMMVTMMRRDEDD